MTTNGVDLPRRFAAEMGRILGPDFPGALGLAVSGGGDSMAMLGLAVPWARQMGITLKVATVDHGLRAAAGAEAALVAHECASLGISHDILPWSDWDKRGNLQMAAREARRALIGAWRGDLRHILFAHTQDDQAETVLMRLARGSGVEGLAGMAAITPTPDGWNILRPLLSTRRAELRHYAKVLQIPFVDDPSNDDPGFDRVRTRKALDVLADLGITRDKLASTATAMQGARQALAARMHDVAATCVSDAFGHLQIQRDAFATIEPDTQRRLMAAALQWTAHAPYRPRLDSLTRVLDETGAGKSATLHGCQIIVGKSQFHIVRELDKVNGLRVPSSRLWDHVWGALAGGQSADRYIAVLGQNGLAQLEKPENTPAAALYSLPALWEGDRVLAAPGLKSPESCPENALFRSPVWQQDIQLGIWR